MPDFVTSCLTNIADTANKVVRRTRSRPGAKRLLKLLAGKKRILITSHLHPDPDAIASCMAMRTLLRAKLPKDVEICISIKGPIAGGVNAAFNQLASLDLTPWEDEKLKTHYDAILLLDVQPQFAYSPIPTDVQVLAVIDHHRARGRPPKLPFRDIRPDVGSSTSIVFSYLMEQSVDIDSQLGATLLYAIESDLAGAAGQPNELDNVAISNLTLCADPRLLYQMRYAELPREYYIAFARGVSEAFSNDSVLTSFLGPITTPEMTAVVADFLLRLSGIQWVLVTATYNGRLILSLRTNAAKSSAGEMMRKLIRGLGEGGGHRTKAGGFIKLENGTPTEVERARATLRKRLLKLLGLPKDARLARLVPGVEG
ncbi:MAG: DHH family phosphoesterase [Tepidisphaeraceae bacterium]